MKAFKGIIRVFSNFYVLVGAMALVWMLFFDRYNVFSQLRQRSKVNKLEEELRYSVNEKARIENLGIMDENNMEELERYARERYFMKKPGEDLFIVEEKPEE